MAEINQCLVFEGVDGSGKTTLAQSLVSAIGGAYFKTPGDGYKPVRPYIDNGTPPEAKLLFYLSSVFDASAKMREALKTQPAVCDRFLWSSLIPFSVYFDRNLNDVEQFVSPVSRELVVPDHTILVTVSEEEQLARLQGGRDLSNPTASDKFCLNEKLRKGVRRAYEQIAERDGWTKVDTTNRSVDDVVAEITERCGFLEYAPIK